jgi:CMP/dCMP kinase
MYEGASCVIISYVTGSEMGIPKQGKVIAIDGPAGTGKSSTAKRLAESLKFLHIDTGALYRAIAYLAEENSQDPIVVAKSVNLEFKRVEKKNPANRIFANGKDVTSFIRTPEISMGASRISAIPEVRAALLGFQRRLGCSGNSILEGRDIGTIIFPDADLKFYLTASIKERAKRRLAELEATGADVPSFKELERQMKERDQNDMTRSVAPLKRATDAIELDTSDLTLDEVVQKMEAEARSRFGI